jgi:hypothetical protein
VSPFPVNGAVAFGTFGGFTDAHDPFPSTSVSTGR